jgi:hypothetical protein
MQWQVDGADRTTGEDKAFLITADTEAQARAIAEAHGLYVSAAAPYVDPNYTPEEAAAAAAPDPEPQPEPTPTLPPPGPPRRQQSRYAATPAPHPAPAPAAAYPQDTLPYARPGASRAAGTFADVPGAARRLRAADVVLSIFGWLYVALGLVGGLIILIATVRLGTAGLDASALLTTLVLPLALIAVGVLLLGAGAAMRMLASIGIATTEIARRKQ